jgi:hypothetical protein
MAKILTAEPFPSFFCGFNSGAYIQGTAAEMMNIYWKCKTFNYGGSYKAYNFNNPEFPPLINTGWTGTLTSTATSEIDLVCGAGFTQTSSVYGLLNSARFVDYDFQGSNFYFNSNSTQTVKLYNNFYFETDQDDAPGIQTIAGGNLSPFLINGFQVYDGDGVPVNYDSPNGIIFDFSAYFNAGDIWPYQ